MGDSYTIESILPKSWQMAGGVVSCGYDWCGYGPGKAIDSSSQQWSSGVTRPEEGLVNGITLARV